MIPRSTSKICLHALPIASLQHPVPPVDQAALFQAPVQSEEDQRSQSPAPVIIHPDGNSGRLDTLHLHLASDKVTHTTTEHLCKLWRWPAMRKQSIPTVSLSNNPSLNWFNFQWFGFIRESSWTQIVASQTTAATITKRSKRCLESKPDESAVETKGIRCAPQRCQSCRFA